MERYPALTSDKLDIDSHAYESKLSGEQISALSRALEVKQAALAKLARFKNAISKLTALRYELFPESSLTPNDTERDMPIFKRLYDEPTYDAYFVRNLLDLRGRGVREFHNESEKYGPSDANTDTIEDRNHRYRQAIMQTGVELGFIKDVNTSNHAPERALNISTDHLIELRGHYDTIIVPGAAGISNPARLIATLRALQEPKLTARQVLITACERKVSDAEAQRVRDAGFQAGDTEFTSSILAAEGIFGIDSSQWQINKSIPPYPSTQSTQVATAQNVMIDANKSIDVIIISAPPESGRIVNGRAATRANTADTFRAAYEFIGRGEILIMSHDAWINGQEAVAEQTFHLENGNPARGVGPYKSDRIASDDLIQAEAVVDEIAKTYEMLARTVILSENFITTEIQKAIDKPLPDYSCLRELKAEIGYRHLPIDKNHEKFNEPLVKLGDLGVAGQSYYSRPNAANPDAITGIDKDIYIRQSVAEKLVLINQLLAHPEVTKLFGRPVELYVEEGMRSRNIQQVLYDQYMPHAIQQQFPEMPENDALKRRDQLVAQPSNDDSPSPHATGGAVDIRLRYIPSGDWTPDFIPDSLVDMGFYDGEVSQRANPEYFEHDVHPTEVTLNARQARRLLHNLMEQFGFTVNPNEWWHYDIGNQLSSLCGSGKAYYGKPPYDIDYN